MIRTRMNGKPYELDVDPDMALAWVLRENLGLTGTKISCGAGLCGYCTVHLDGQAARSCVTPVCVSAAAGHAVTTIEGPTADGIHPVLRAWIAEEVVQCGFCQPGFIMATAALLAARPHPTDAETASATSVDAVPICGFAGPAPGRSIRRETAHDERADAAGLSPHGSRRRGSCKRPPMWSSAAMSPTSP